MRMKEFLTVEQKTTLKTQHRREHDGRIRDRIKAILLANDGWTLSRGVKIQRHFTL